MFEASVDGEAYDADRFGQYFRPAGMAARTGDPNVSSTNGTATSRTEAPAATPAPAAETAPVAEATPAPKAEESKPAESENNAQDILAMIRSRQNN